MGKKLFEFSKDITSKGLYESLSKAEKTTIDKYRDYSLITASPIRAEEGIREVLRFKEVIGKGLNDIDLDDLRHFLKELKESSMGDLTKNKIKSFIQRFLRWNFKDWSERFNEFTDIKLNGDAQRIKPITSKEILSKADIELLMKNEPSLYWKTFLIVQYEGALRTGEVRALLWDKVNFEDDGFCSLKIPCKKNKNGTVKFREIPLKEAEYFLRELKEQQRKAEIKTPFVFPSPHDTNQHISKAVNLWFNHLTKKVLGRPINNYLLRHSRGTELKRIIKEGGMSKDNAVEFMGHSEKMFDKVYSHMDKEDIKELMKKQIYKFEYVPEEKKHKLELKIEAQQKQINELVNAIKKDNEIFAQHIKMINEVKKELGIKI